MQEQSNKYEQALTAFFRLSKDDTRLSCTHISLYTVLLRYWLKSGKNPISITRRDVMKYAKIRSTATYTHSIYDLQEFGYLTYEPSYHPFYGSSVTLHLPIS